ncbi:MAG: enoyl-CoA hydratase/isomerase family protein [Candidatus Omnitrophica bacterium]|nr:enoyl-CoA hydratase/isomerase family protein [Candidatus Omnitrophota bacterium]MBU4458108.1 enoyl-CoA hydratase/isomerase family protein [Candidatus Omnitrophota bacterium]
MLNYYKKDNIGIIEFNDRDSRVNLLSSENIDEMRSIIESLAKDTSTRALFFISSKKDIFLAGADIKELVSLETKEEAELFCKKGQELLDKIEQLKMPTVAVLDGSCIGGGLELALSCRTILATGNKKIKIGLPETMLGISPGFGGTRRLARKTGLRCANDLINSGRLVSPREAVKLKIVDRLIPESEKVDYRRLSSYNSSCRPHRGSGAPPRRGRQEAAGTLSPEYAGELDRMEREIFAKKVLQEDARNGLGSFLLMSKYKKRAWLDSAAGKALPVKNCGIIGAGIMGKGITYLVSSRLDIPVTVTDVNGLVLKKAKGAIKKIYADAVKRDIFSNEEAASRFRRISYASGQSDTSDIVIESVVEDGSIKKELFSGLEKTLDRECIITTNTSCLPIEELAGSLRHADRFIGTHFFNPAYKMKLVEVVPGSFTSKSTLKTVVCFLQDMGRIPVIVKDSPGFLVNRILLPYLNEAVFMLEEGIAAGKIDSAMLDFGMPAGPLQLLKDIGLDVACKAGKTLEEKFGNRVKVPQTLANEDLRTRLLKTQLYQGQVMVRPEDVRNRLLETMRREARMCLEEKIVDNPEVIDLALFLGIGFPGCKRIWKN